MGFGERLREEAERKYGKRGAIKKLSEDLDIKMSNLYIYLKNKSKPGADILLKLGELGFDVPYILKGGKYDDPQEIFNMGFNIVKEKAFVKKQNECERIKNENIKLKAKIAEYEKLIEKLIIIKERE